MNKEMEARYSNMNISTLEDEVRNGMKDYREGLIKVTEILIYLKTTGRYKENKRYAREPFSVYLEDNFSIRPGTFQNQERAVLLFREESKEHGIGLVSKTLGMCGQQRAKIVFNEIESTEAKANKPLSRAKIEKIIEQHRDPRRKVKVKDIVDWKGMYETEKAAHDKTKEVLRMAKKRIEELEEQVGKLKQTAKVIHDIKTAVGKLHQASA